MTESQDLTTQAKLRLIVQRIERLEEEKRGIAADISDVKAEAKSQGFDVATINRIIKVRRMTDQKREEMDALFDLYKAALGMLDGTPLGESAIRRLSSRKRYEPKDDDDQNDQPPQQEAPAPPKFMPEVDIQGAHEMGSKAAKDGMDVVQNPFPARDPRRAAWDEAWCQELGSDGMEIPAALRPTKPKKSDDKKDEENK